MEMGQMVSPLTVADHFDGLLDGFVLDHADGAVANAVQLPTLATATMMTDLASKTQLAREILDFGAELMDGQKPAPRPSSPSNLRPHA
jgi:LPPG:FO 2-phospho-L-lactate transferase